MKFFSRILLLVCLLGVCVARAATNPPPNFIVILCDDMGYNDIGPFGAKTRTPNLDRMAREGMRFTDFYVGQPVCSASRAALLTGCYPTRVGILGALGPKSKVGIGAGEVILPELLKTRGYTTALYGKWHLGDAPEFSPLRHGFDDYFGLPYSNDMWPKHPTGTYPALPLIDGEHIVALNPDQTTLTTRYTEHAIRFIEENQSRPFFLYLAHNMPHVPLHVSEKYRGKSGRGLYADVIMEIDWSVGQVMRTLKRLKLDRQTLVVFTSDNGPWLSYGNHAGSALPLREGKATVWDGGARVPCLMRWPGQIPAGTTCRELATTMDLLPTFARLAGGEPPQDRRIDGVDIWPLLSGQPGAKAPRDTYFYYWGRELQAVRSGAWKLHFAHSYITPEPAGRDGKPGKMATKNTSLELYNLSADISEKNNVATQFPDVVKRLQELAEKCRDDMGDSLTKRDGKNVRAPGQTKL
ncbi:MAG TPA: sulfatase [Verrucomicrobiae bacterium]|nr:sulfatase [Verrucomicrobiae bacterium]